MIEAIFGLSESIRYVAVYKNGDLQSQAKANMEGASSSESDKDFGNNNFPKCGHPFVLSLSKQERVAASAGNFPSILRQAQDERKILSGSYL